MSTTSMTKSSFPRGKTFGVCASIVAQQQLEQDLRLKNLFDTETLYQWAVAELAQRHPHTKCSTPLRLQPIGHDRVAAMHRSSASRRLE
jgi:hypothetical protein